MHKQRLTILILAAIGMVATFLPWISIPIIGTLKGTEGDGWITLGFFAISLALALIGDKSKQIQGGALYGAIIPSLGAVGIGVWKILIFSLAKAEAKSGLGNDTFAGALVQSVSLEMGIFLVVLMGLAVPIAGFWLRDKDNPNPQSVAGA